MDIQSVINKLNKILNEDYTVSDISYIDEDLTLVDSGDDEVQLGDYYNAYTEEDLINCLDEMIIGDSTGCILQSKFNSKLFAELTINFLDVDLYEAVFETDDFKKNKTSELSKNDMLEFIQSLLQQYNVSSFEYRREVYNEN